MKRRFWAALNALAVFAALLLLWRGIIWAFHIPVYMLPPPAAVAHAEVERRAALLKAIWITGSAAAGGLVAALLVGVSVALVFAQSPQIRRLFFPYTIVLQTVPIVAVAPLILMWIGAGPVAVTFIAFIMCVAPIIANTTQGLISVEQDLLNLFLIHNASPSRIFFKLRLPHAVPSLFVGLRIASGIAVIGAIIGELFAGSNRVGEGGLGYSIVYASGQLETDYLVALVLAATALGFFFFAIVGFLEWYFLHNWHESAQPQEHE